MFLKYRELFQINKRALKPSPWSRQRHEYRIHRKNINEKKKCKFSLTSNKFELTHEGCDILKTERRRMQNKGGMFIPWQWSVATQL